MKIRGFRHIVIITVTQFAVVPCINVFELRKVPRMRRIIDGVEIDLFYSNSFTRTVLVRTVSSYEHHINNSIPDVMQFRRE